MKQGSIVFAADDGSEFSLPVNDDGTCGPLPRAGVAMRWDPPPMVGTIAFKDAASASCFANLLRYMGFDVETHRSPE